MPLVYDVYGTLLDVNAAARIAADEKGMEKFKPLAQQVSATWRQRQLAHTWLMTLMGCYDDFWEITCRTLDMTLAEYDLADNQLIRERLLALYLDLEAYDEVPQELTRMRDKKFQLGILSNGTPSMLERALKTAKIAEHFDHVLSVDVLACYKPKPSTYQLAIDTFGCKAGEITFFSSNAWDIAGATHFGFNTIWINRAGLIWDAPNPKPKQEAKSLKEAHALIA